MIENLPLHISLTNSCYVFPFLTPLFDNKATQTICNAATPSILNTRSLCDTFRRFQLQLFSPRF